MKKKIECAYCAGNAELKESEMTFNHKKKLIKVMALFYKCDKCKEEFTTNEIDDITINRVKEKGKRIKEMNKNKIIAIIFAVVIGVVMIYSIYCGYNAIN